MAEVSQVAQHKKQEKTGQWETYDGSLPRKHARVVETWEHRRSDTR
jgi:hypothetical protein